MRQTIGPRIAIGPSLKDLMLAGHAVSTIQVDGRALLIRPDPFHEEPQEPGVAPFIPEFADPTRRTAVTGPVSLVCLRDVSVLGRDGLAVYQDRVIWDTLQSNAAWQGESLIARENDQGSLVLTKPLAGAAPTATPVMLGYVGAWSNYAHWITECLPRAVSFLRLRRHEPEATLLMPSLPSDSPQLAILRRLGIGPESMRMLANDEVVRAERVWAIQGLGVWHPPALCRVAALELSMAVALDAAEADRGRAERVYIQRGSPIRRLANFHELQPIIAEFGFVVIRMQDLSADDQVRHLRNARYVVGENSGGLANIMFCRRGARVLELNNPGFAHPAHWALAGLIGADYGYCMGQHADTRLPDMNSDYVITPERLTRALTMLTRPS